MGLTTTIPCVLAYHETDFMGQAKPTSLLHYFQQAAWENASSLKFGPDELKAIPAIWALQSIYLKIEDFPRWNDHFEVTTWPRGADRLFALRDLQISKEEKILIAGTSRWVMVHVDKRVPIRLSTQFPDFPALDQPAVDWSWKKHRAFQPVKTLYHEVNYMHLDSQHHVNNAQYLEWSLAAIPLEMYREYQLKELEIHFQSELQASDKIELQVSRQEQQWVVLGLKANQKPTFSCWLSFRPKPL